MRIRWSAQPGVGRYRLQLARDEQFTDIVFDEAVMGSERQVENLAPGRYYWRVAPAVDETGPFSRPTPVEITAGRPVVVAGAVQTPAAHVGWRAATGEIPLPVPARLRSATSFDLVGINANGVVYALNAANGMVLWIARPPQGEDTTGAANSSFAPVAIEATERAPSLVVVPFAGGIRALNGATGREVWRASLRGRAAAGQAADLDGDGAAEIIVTTESPAALYVFQRAGAAVSQTDLAANAIGPPLPFLQGETRGVALALANNLIELRRANGSLIKAVSLDARLTTSPVVTASSDGQRLWIGTSGGLVAFALDGLRPLGRVETGEDLPRGRLSAADLNGDGALEVIMLTQSGRVVLIGANDGRIKWLAEGATDAAAAVFADLNGDGTLDVLVAGGQAFALGFSGRDGALIWRAEDVGQAMGGAGLRGLAVAPLGGDAAFLIGSDPARMGLRAADLPRGALRAAAN